jgi:signal transduction histidine kinase
VADAPDADAERATIDLLRRRVLNVVGHELRTPVTTLRGLAESLGSTDDPKQEAALHDAIRRTARRTEALLDDLLLAAGVSTALPVAAPEPTSVLEAARAAWRQLESVTEEDDVTVQGDVAALAAPGVVEKVLREVLDNAVRYGDEPTEVRCATDAGDAVIVVADRGLGVPEAELPLLTEAFFRGERAVLGHHSLGLGLAVVRALVEHQGGIVEVRNVDGGFEVELRLPAA